MVLARRDASYGGISWRVYDDAVHYHREYKVVRDGSPYNMGREGMASPRREAFFTIWHLGWALLALHLAVSTVVRYMIGRT
jgi:hypothetical protein